MKRFLLRSSVLVLVSGFLAATGAPSLASPATTNASNIETGDMSAQRRVVRRTTVVRGPAIVDLLWSDARQSCAQRSSGRSDGHGRGIITGVAAAP